MSNAPNPNPLYVVCERGGGTGQGNMRFVERVPRGAVDTLEAQAASVCRLHGSKYVTTFPTPVGEPTTMPQQQSPWRCQNP